MKRNICIVNDNSNNLTSSIESVHISNIQNLINCSVDYIVCYVLEYIDPNQCDATIRLLLEKLRPNGYMLIAFTDFKFLCEKYSKSQLSDKDFLQNALGKTNILSIEKITACVNPEKFTVSKIDGEGVLSLTIHRTHP